MARRLTSLTAADDIPTICRVDPFDKEHPTPSVSYCILVVLSCLAYFSASFGLFSNFIFMVDSVGPCLPFFSSAAS
jgi:hypothetical protein